MVTQRETTYAIVRPVGQRPYVQDENEVAKIRALAAKIRRLSLGLAGALEELAEVIERQDTDAA